MWLRGKIERSRDQALQSSTVEKMALKIPNRIFVGGIAYRTTKLELKEFFDRYGAVRESKIIYDNGGLSKGFGFVTFYREEDAKKVLAMGSIFFKEKRLNISEAYRRIPSFTMLNYQAPETSLPQITNYCASDGLLLQPFYPGIQLYESPHVFQSLPSTQPITEVVRSTPPITEVVRNTPPAFGAPPPGFSPQNNLQSAMSLPSSQPITEAVRITPPITETVRNTPPAFAAPQLGFPPQNNLQSAQGPEVMYYSLF